MATMHRMLTQIEIYEQMSLLSSRMVEAARANEWDQLIALEQNVSALRDTLMSNASEEDLAPELVSRKRNLIQRILDDDAEVRRHTEPWMEHVRQFLGQGARRRSVMNAYAAGAGESYSDSLGV